MFPDLPGKGVKIVRDKDTLRLAHEGGQRVAIRLVGVDEVAEAVQGLVIEGIAVAGRALLVRTLQNGEGILEVLEIEDAADAGGVVGRVGLEAAAL